MTGAPTRRSLVATVGLFAGVSLLRSTLLAQEPAGDPTSFLATYDAAWERHDPHALALLHAEDVLVVNRFGSMLEGREELERAMAFLHGPGGPFHAIRFPAQRLLVSRTLGSDMATLHASWKNPVMAEGDVLANPGEQKPWVDIVSTYLLARRGGTWQILQQDLHSVDLIKIPIQTKWNN